MGSPAPLSSIMPGAGVPPPALDDTGQPLLFNSPEEAQTWRAQQTAPAAPVLCHASRLRPCPHKLRHHLRRRTRAVCPCCSTHPRRLKPGVRSNNSSPRQQPLRRQPLRRQPLRRQPLRRQPLRRQPLRRQPLSRQPLRRQSIRRQIPVSGHLRAAPRPLPAARSAVWQGLARARRWVPSSAPLAARWLGRQFLPGR